MKKILIFLMLLFIGNTNLYAQDVTDEENLQGMYMTRAQMDKIIENIEPELEKWQADIRKEWDSSPLEVKIKECNKRYDICVKAALEGGSANRLKEESRRVFCNFSKRDCGESWQ